MDELTARFEWVIVDSPPILPLADASVWMRSVDGVLLVARQGTTEKRQLERGIEAIESKKLIGALLNSSKNPAHSSYYYYRKPAVSSRELMSRHKQPKSPGSTPIALHPMESTSTVYQHV